MEVTVKMYPEEYDLFREYQREKASLEREMSADYDRLCEKHGNLCKKILDATTVSEATIYAEDMAKEQKHQTEAIKEVKTDLSDLSGKVEKIEAEPGNRWKTLVEKVILLVTAAVVGYILARVGL